MAGGAEAVDQSCATTPGEGPCEGVVCAVIGVSTLRLEKSTDGMLNQDREPLLEVDDNGSEEDTFSLPGISSDGLEFPERWLWPKKKLLRWEGDKVDGLVATDGLLLELEYVSVCEIGIKVVFLQCCCRLTQRQLPGKEVTSFATEQARPG